MRCALGIGTMVLFITTCPSLSLVVAPLGIEALPLVLLYDMDDDNRVGGGQFSFYCFYSLMIVVTDTNQV